MDDIALFVDEAAPTESPSDSRPPWEILIVDDDQSVHEVTQLVLSHFEFDDRKLQFTSCYSAAEARSVLEKRDDFALILLDVVMENDHAGLDLVSYIRDTLDNRHIRIILRTGQPGQAPEEDVVRNYDINDYKSKTELTTRKMVTAFYTALRCYRDIMLIEESRDGLRRSIEAITRVYDSRNLRSFASTVLEQINHLLRINGEGICASRATAYAGTSADGNFKVLAVTKEYEDVRIDSNLELLPPEVRDAFERTLANKAGFHTDHVFVGYHPANPGYESVIYMSFAQVIDPAAIEFLEIFSTNIAVTYEGLLLREETQEAQQTAIHILSEANERCSHEHGMHAHRLGELSGLFAQLLNLPEHDVTNIRLSAPLHDIGKIAVPENVINKPGKLDDNEWDVMKNHAPLGQNLLNQSNTQMMKMGATIANEHHEKWDGTGYPRGLKGEQIHIAGRIVALVDVLDVLVSKRSYKEAWSWDEALAHIQTESGRHFDPALVDLLLAHQTEVRDIYQRFPD